MRGLLGVLGRREVAYLRAGAKSLVKLLAAPGIGIGADEAALRQADADSAVISGFLSELGKARLPPGTLAMWNRQAAMD